MAQDSYTLRILAEVNDFQQGLSKIPGITEKQAAKAAAALAAQLARGTKAATKDAEAAAKKVGDVFGKAGGTAAKLGGALSMISPEAAAAAGAINDLGDVGEVAAEIWEGAGAAIQANALVLGTLAAALVVAAAAYRAVTLEITREQERLAFEADLSKQATASAKKLADAQLALQVATGELSEEEGALLQIRLASRDSLREILVSNDKKISQIQADLEATQKYVNAQRGLAAVLAVVADLGAGLPVTIARMAAEHKTLGEIVRGDMLAINDLIDGLTGLEAGADQSRHQIAQLRQASVDEAKAAKATNAALIEGERARRRAGEATDAQAEAEEYLRGQLAATAAAEQRLRDETEARVARQEEISARETALVGEAVAARSDLLTEEQRIEQERQAARARTLALASEQLEAVRGNSILEAELRQQTQDALTAIDERAARERKQITEEEAKATLQIQREAQQAQQAAALGLATSTIQAVSDLSSEILSSGLADTKAGLGALFAAQKAAAVAQAAINTAVAVSNSLALPLPPPLPQIAAAGALIAGATQAALIAATPPPSFRSGYLPDQKLAYIEPSSEMVVPASGVQALGGREQAAATFAGVAPAAAPQITQFTLGHRAFNSMISTYAPRPGALRDLTVRPKGRTNPYRS